MGYLGGNQHAEAEEDSLEDWQGRVNLLRQLGDGGEGETEPHGPARSAIFSECKEQSGKHEEELGGVKSVDGLGLLFVNTIDDGEDQLGFRGDN